MRLNPYTHTFPTYQVFIVTGSTSGVGFNLAKILYGANARVYMLARSTEKAERALNAIHTAHPTSTGHVEFISLDLSDLQTIKTTAEAFLSKESRLDVLWLNAGVMIPPAGSVSAQNYDLQLGTNCLGHFLLTRYLTPTIVKTTKSAPKDSVRVIWVSSAAAALPPVPAVDFDNITYAKDDEDIWMRYGRSKAGNVLHAVEYGRRMADDGVVSLVRRQKSAAWAPTVDQKPIWPLLHLARVSMAHQWRV